MGSDTGNCVIFNHCYTLAHLQRAQTMGYHNDSLSLTEILNGFVTVSYTHLTLPTKLEV